MKLCELVPKNRERYRMRPYITPRNNKGDSDIQARSFPDLSTES
jgi:hypothetical protein